ncbi:carbohydrate ABC transporter permease [Kocuria nitroreducens]|uniref:carbohydrate ABC transporter permease n=1 Tax=Kocuria nitroreducens TaxID=3058914 RepID=UPI0036D9C780
MPSVYLLSPLILTWIVSFQAAPLGTQGWVGNLVTSLMGLLLFNEGVGVVNGLLRDLAGDGLPWPSDGTPAMLSVVAMTIRTRVAFAMAFPLAALQDAPERLCEAARPDGAGAWQVFRCVALPLLAPSTPFLVVMNVIWSFQIVGIDCTFCNVILPSAATAPGIFLARQFFLWTPQELLEAARPDGAGQPRLLAAPVAPHPPGR